MAMETMPTNDKVIAGDGKPMIERTYRRLSNYHAAPANVQKRAAAAKGGGGTTNAVAGVSGVVGVAKAAPPARSELRADAVPFTGIVAAACEQHEGLSPVDALYVHAVKHGLTLTPVPPAHLRVQLGETGCCEEGGSCCSAACGVVGMCLADDCAAEGGLLEGIEQGGCSPASVMVGGSAADGASAQMMCGMAAVGGSAADGASAQMQVSGMAAVRGMAAVGGMAAVSGMAAVGSEAAVRGMAAVCGAAAGEVCSAV